MIPRFVATFLLVGATLAQAQDFDARMDQIVQSYVSNKQFKGSVLVAKGSDILLSKGYGSAYYPEAKPSVAVLGNLNGQAPYQIATTVAALVRGATVTLQSERKEITLDPKVMSRYVGTYQMGPGSNMVITMDGNRLFSKLGNQNPVPVFAESETKFFAKVVDAQLEFSGSDAQGRATLMTLHQNGRSQPAKRLDDAESKRIADAAADLAKRIKDQTQGPGTEAALRGLIEGLISGKPNYDQMIPNLAGATRAQLSQLQSMVKPRGALQSLTFKGVGPAGADIYVVRFENGSFEYRIMLDADGKIAGGQLNGVNVQ